MGQGCIHQAACVIDDFWFRVSVSLRHVLSSVFLSWTQISAPDARVRFYGSCNHHVPKYLTRFSSCSSRAKRVQHTQRVYDTALQQAGATLLHCLCSWTSKPASPSLSLISPCAKLQDPFSTRSHNGEKIGDGVLCKGSFEHKR